MLNNFDRLVQELDQLADYRSQEAITRARHLHHARVRSDLRKSLSNLGRLTREMTRQTAKAKARDEAAWLDRIAAGMPTEADLVKAHAALDAATGKMPTSMLNAMDLQLRNLESRMQHQAGTVMAKSMTAGFDLGRARAQLDGLWAAGKINGSAYRLADLRLRGLETSAHA